VAVGNADDDVSLKPGVRELAADIGVGVALDLPVLGVPNLWVWGIRRFSSTLLLSETGQTILGAKVLLATIWSGSD
jgi:hypothetical protein